MRTLVNYNGPKGAGLNLTAAFVMLWAEPLYKTGPAREFIDLPDFVGTRA